MKRLGQSNQDGFTIVELMIATIVFATVLLVCTMGLLQISRTYYRGIVSSRTQEVTRTILQDVSESVRLGGGTVVPNIAPSGTVRGLCAGGKRYSFEPYMQLNDAVATQRHALVVDDMAACTSGTPAQNINGGTLTATSREMMNTRMRIADFRICAPGDTVNCPTGAPPATSSLYKVVVRVITGENDLILDRNGDGNINAADAPLECKVQGSGGQFCAVSELSTVVQKRL